MQLLLLLGHCEYVGVLMIRSMNAKKCEAQQQLLNKYKLKTSVPTIFCNPQQNNKDHSFGVFRLWSGYLLLSEW